jgi:hypothetical protein
MIANAVINSMEMMVRRAIRLSVALPIFSVLTHGFPRRTRTAFKKGGLFKEVTSNRGRPMSPASATA